MEMFLLYDATLSVPNANAKIAKLMWKSARKRTANAVHQTGKVTRTATTRTITVHATGMVGTAAVRRTLFFCDFALLCFHDRSSSGKKNDYKFCKKCECLDPEKQECSAKCGSPSWTNDGICDDNNNNCGCGWDKGDCCGDSGKADQRKHCKDCKVRAVVEFSHRLLCIHWVTFTDSRWSSVYGSELLWLQEECLSRRVQSPELGRRWCMRRW